MIEVSLDKAVALSHSWRQASAIGSGWAVIILTLLGLFWRLRVQFRHLDAKARDLHSTATVLRGSHAVPAEKSKSLETTQRGMDQGIATSHADGEVVAWNGRQAAGLDLPQALPASQPDLAKLAADQKENGACTTVLPLAGAAGEVAATADPGDPDSALQTLHVLVADDDMVNQHLLVALLKSAGHLVTTATNGRRAVEALTRDHFDIILMAERMPVMDGIQATSHIRRLQPPKSEIPIIALTAEVLPDAAERFRTAGMDSYLSKPLAPLALFRAMRELTGSGRPRRSAADRMPAPDRSVIDALRAFLSHEELEALLTESIADVGIRIQRLQASLQAADVARAGGEAHDLVSVAGNCGARALSTLAREIEHACKQGLLAVAKERFTRMDGIATNAISAMADLRDDLAEQRALSS